LGVTVFFFSCLHNKKKNKTRPGCIIKKTIAFISLYVVFVKSAKKYIVLTQRWNKSAITSMIYSLNVYSFLFSKEQKIKSLNLVV